MPYTLLRMTVFDTIFEMDPTLSETVIPFHVKLIAIKCQEKFLP